MDSKDTDKEKRDHSEVYEIIKNSIVRTRFLEYSLDQEFEIIKDKMQDQGYELVDSYKTPMGIPMGVFVCVDNLRIITTALHEEYVTKCTTTDDLIREFKSFSRSYLPKEKERSILSAYINSFVDFQEKLNQYKHAEEEKEKNVVNSETEPTIIRDRTNSKIITLMAYRIEELEEQLDNTGMAVGYSTPVSAYNPLGTSIGNGWGGSWEMEMLGMPTPSPGIMQNPYLRSHSSHWQQERMMKMRNQKMADLRKRQNVEMEDEIDEKVEVEDEDISECEDPNQESTEPEPNTNLSEESVKRYKEWADNMTKQFEERKKKSKEILDQIKGKRKPKRKREK